ncbi:MAG: MBL fold metallo-hydrolase [Dehalococcoidia bacterium]
MLPPTSEGSRLKAGDTQSVRFPAILQLGWSKVYVHRSSEGLILIDAGPDYEGSWQSLCGQLAEHDFSPDDVRHVLITHAHLDHAGLATRWHDLGVRVWIGEADAAALAAGEDGATAMRAVARPYLQAQGVPAERFGGGRQSAVGSRDGGEGIRRGQESSPSLDRSKVTSTSDREAVGAWSWRADAGGPDQRAAPSGRQRSTASRMKRGQYEHAGHWPAPLRFPPATDHEILQEGMMIGGLRVLACPGHTPGSIAFFDSVNRILYSGDHLLPGITPSPGLSFAQDRRLPCLPQWCRSLRRLLDLGEVRVMPGHGEPFVDLPSMVERNLAHIEQRARRLLRLLQSRPGSPYELLLRLFPHLPEGLLWFKLAEVLGLLDLLQDRQLVLRDGSEFRVASSK